jgi:hypothetical protein
LDNIELGLNIKKMGLHKVMKTHFFGKIRGNGLHKDDEVPSHEKIRGRGLHKDDEVPVTQKTIAKQPSSKIERS